MYLYLHNGTFTLCFTCYICLMLHSLVCAATINISYSFTELHTGRTLRELLWDQGLELVGCQDTA